MATTLITPDPAPVIAGIRLRSGKTGSGKGSASMVREAIATARAAGARSEILVRGDSAYAQEHHGRRLPEGRSAVLGGAGHEPRRRAIRAIARRRGVVPSALSRRGAVVEPETGQLVSDAEVAETTFTAFASTKKPVTARPVVRRVRNQKNLAELFPVWGHHPLFTHSLESTEQADMAHRQHAVIETGFADLIDGRRSR